MRDIDSLLGSMQGLDPLAPIQKEGGPQKPDALSILENASSTQSISMEDPFGLDGMESMLYSATDRIGNVIMPGSDPFETAARSQSSWDKLANGLVKAGANFSSVVAGGTLGLGAGIAQGLINLSDEDETTGFWDGVIKNGFVDSLDSMNESLRQYMPNFKTQKEQEASLGQSISTVNFWADDFANGISFTLGALATESIYSAITTATLGAASPLQAAGTARLALQTARVFKGFKRNLSAAQKAAPFTRAELRTAVNIAAPINQTGKLTRQIFTGAGYEAAFEARTGYNEMVESTLYKMREENPGVEYTEKDIDQETMANIRSISNYQFVGNLALVSSSNFIIFGKTFQVPKIREFARMAKAGKIVKNEAGEWIQKPLSKFAKARLITKHATKGILSEGFMEEGGQGIMSRMAINHLNKSKTPEGLEEAYSLYGNLVNTISAAKGEKEFQKEILIGSIIGLFGNAVTDPKSIFKDNLFTKAHQIWKDQNPEYAPFLEHIEKGKFNSFTKANVDFLAAEYSTNEEYIEGLLQNDMASVKDAENASIFDYAYGRYMMGLDSAIEEDIKSIEKKTEEEFIEEFLKDKNISKEDAKKIQQKAVDKMRRQISEFQQNMKDSTSFFAGQSEDVQKGGAWLFFSHRESIERYDSVVQSLSEDFKSINSYVLKKFVDNTAVHNFQKMFPELNKAITDKINEGRKEAKKKLKEGASEIDILNSEEFKAWKKTKEYKAWKKNLEQNPEIKKFRRLIKAKNKETGKSQTEQEIFDSLVEGIEARMDLEVAIKIDSSRQHDLQKIREAKNNLDDLIYLKNKKETIDQFIGKLVENPEGRNPEKEAFIRDIDRNAEEVAAELARGLQERAKTSKIEELTKKTSQVERIASERAGDRLEKEGGSQADFAKTFLSEIGELLRRAETGKAILEEEAAKAAEEAGESTATSNPPPVDPLSPDSPVFDPQEQELKDDETESENGSPRTAYQTLTDRLKFAGKHDDIFVTDENGNIVYENGEPLHKEEFRESNPDHQKNRDNDNNFRTYRAIFSIFKIINGEEDHYLVDEDGDSITSLSEMVLKTYGPNQGLENILGTSEISDIEKRRQGINGIEEIIFSNPNFKLEGFKIDGNYWNVVTSTDRAKVLVNVNGVIVPFYLTTGQAGKGLVPGWYPFFGIGNDGWLNKTDKSDMETYYERYWGKEAANIAKSISEELNSFYGTDPSAFKNDGDPNATSRPLTTLADKVEDYINSKLNYTPAINNADARKTLRSNVEQLGKEINAKYDAELAALDKSWFESKAVKGKNPLVARLETTEGKPVKIKGKDVVFYMQEDTFTTKSVDEKGNTKVYTRFRFGKFFEKRGLPFTIADLGDLNTLDERIKKATEDDKHLYLLQKEQKKWKELREKLVKGEDPLEIPLTAIRINPGRSTGKNTKERTQVLDMFNGDIEFFEKAVEEKRVFLQAVKGGKGYKKKDGVGEATFSYTDKVLGGRIPGAPGQVHLIVDNQSWRVSKNPIGPKGRERVADIIRASVLALEARAKDKEAQGPMITYWEGGDTKYNQLNIGEYLRNIAGIVIPGPNNFTVIDGKAVLNAETIKKIEENNWVYLSNIWWSKEENKFKTFNKFESSWNFHYQDPKTGKYVTKSFSQIVKRPKKAKQDDPDTADVSGVSIDMEALEEILTGARYRITLPSEEDNMESQMEFITGYDPENKEFTTSKMSLGKWLLADGEPKIEIIGLPEPVSEEKPTIDDLITNGNILSTSMTAVMDLGDSVIEEPEAAEAAETPEAAEARNSSDNSAVPGGVNMGANTSPDSEDVLSGAIDPLGGSMADYEDMQAAIKAAQQNNSKLSDKDTEALDGLFRARPKNSPVSQIPKEEKEWFKKTFPFLETIYGNFDSGIDAMIKKGRVLLNKDARAGTLFHEAFHIFLRSQFKDQASLNAYLQKVKDRLGNRMIITQNGKNILPVRASEASLLQIEEYLAEQYSAYRTVGEFYKFADTQTKNIFQKIWEALKRLFGIKNLSPMQEMFYSLDESGPINITREELESSIPNVLYRASVEELRALPLYHSLFFNSIESKQESEGEMYTSLEGLLEKNPGLFEEVEEKIIALQEAIALKTSPEEAKMYVENIKSITESYKKALAVIGIEEIEDFLETLQERDAVKDNQEYLDRSEKSSFSRAPKVLKIFLSHKFGLLELKRGSTILSNTLETSSSITEMRKRLADLIKNSNDSALTKSFQSILDSVLGNNLTPEMANVQRAFFSTFSQSKVEVAYVLVGDTASIVNSTLKQFTNSLKAAWVNNATSMLSIDPKSTMLDKEDGQIILNQKKFSELKLDDFENSPALVKEVFSKIGLPIEEKERLKDPKAFTIFLGHIADQVREFAAQKETVRLDSLFSEDGTNSKQLAGRLIPIMEVLRQTRPYDVELSSYNESGKKKHAVSLSTFVSKVAAFARQGSPVFDTPLRTKSRLYKAMKKNYFRVVEITGLDSTYSKSTALDKLDPQSQLYTRLEAQMNSLFVLPSDDRKTMRALDVRGTNYDAMSEEIFIERATEHLKIEMEEYLDYISRQTKFNNKEKNFSKGLFAFNKIDQKLGLSRQIGSSKNIERVLEKNKQEIRIYFKKELAFLKQDLSDLLEESGLLKIKRDKENKDKILEKTVLLNPTSFTNNFFGTKRKYNEKELQVGNTPQSKNFVVNSKKQPNTEAVFNAFLTYIAANDFLFALDSSITFSGGLFSYTSITQMYKRHARITSPQTNNANDPETMAYLERDFRRSKMGLNEKGQYKRSLLKVITVRNFLRKSPITGQEMDTTDGFTWMNYETYRDLRLKVGGRWNTADEILYQYNSQMLFREGIKRKHSSLFTPQKFNEIFKGHATYEDAVFPSYKEKPIKELRGRNSKKEDTEVYYLEDLKVSTEIEKPHGIGPAYYPDGSVVENHMMKTAVMPLTYLEHKNDPDIMEMALDMLSEGVDLIQTDSSNKGDKMLDANGNIPTLFKENESFGTFEYVKSAMKNSAQYMAEFPAELFTLQQDPSGDTGLVTTSIQLVSLVKSNILHKLTGEEKERMLKKSRMAEHIIDTIRSRSYDKMIKDLGVEAIKNSLTGEEYLGIPKKNWGKVKNMLLSAVNNSFTSESTKAAIENFLDKEKDFSGLEYLNLDMSSMGEKLSTILTSAMESRVIKLKGAGSQLVQVPNALYSRALEFYQQMSTFSSKHLENTTDYAEIMISFPTKAIPWLKKHFNGSVDELNNAMLNGQVPLHLMKELRLLTDINANRIPTSGMNLIDSFKVVKFLHWTSGKKVVLPDGMTEKGGSDYDIDKLTSYFYSFEMLDDTLVSFSVEDPSKKITQEDLYNYYALAKTNVNSAIKKLESSDSTVTPRQLDRIMEDPLMQKFIPSSSIEAIRFEEEYNTLSEEEKKILIAGETARILRVLKGIVFPKVTSIHEKGFTYGEILSNEYLLNGLQDIYREFITHAENYNALTTPLTMQIFQEAEDVQKLVEEDKKGKNRWEEDNLRGFSLRHSVNVKHRTSIATSDIGTTARALVVQGLLSSSDKKVRTQVKSIFKDFPGYYVLGQQTLSNAGTALHLNSPAYTVIDVLNQLAQGELEIGSDPTVYYANVTGEMNSIFQAMMRLSPTSSQDMPLDYWINFITSPEVREVVKQAEKMSSEVIRIKDKGNHASFPAALVAMSKGRSFIRAFDTNPTKDPHFNKEEFEKALEAFEINLADLSEKSWREANPEKIAVILSFYYSMSSQLAEIDKQIYQDSGFPSGSSQLNLKVLEREKFTSDGRGSNLIWAKEDLDELNSSNRTGNVEKLSKRFNRLLSQLRMRGAHPLIHEKLNEMVKKLPRTKNKEKASASIERTFLAYIIHNELEDMAGYEYILSSSLMDKILEKKKRVTDKDLWNKIEVTSRRIDKKNRTKSLVKTAGLVAPVNDPNEINVLQARMLRHPEVLKELAYLTMAKSGFAYEYQSLTPLLPDDYLMELYAPAYRSFLERIESMEDSDLKQYLARMEDTMFRQLKVLKDESMSTTFDKVVSEAFKIEGIESQAYYALPARDYNLTAWVNTTGEYKGYGFNILPKVPSKHNIKDQQKADYSNALIAYAEDTYSSTSKYKNAALKKGVPINNTIVMKPGTVAMVSVKGGGKASSEELKLTLEKAKQVLKYGGTIIMDSTHNANSSHNASGEGVIQKLLGEPTGKTKEGFNYWGPNPGAISDPAASFEDSNIAKLHRMKRVSKAEADFFLSPEESALLRDVDGWAVYSQVTPTGHVYQTNVFVAQEALGDPDFLPLREDSGMTITNLKQRVRQSEASNMTLKRTYQAPVAPGVFNTNDLSIKTPPVDFTPGDFAAPESFPTDIPSFLEDKYKNAPENQPDFIPDSFPTEAPQFEDIESPEGNYDFQEQVDYLNNKKIIGEVEDAEGNKIRRLKDGPVVYYEIKYKGKTTWEPLNCA